MKAPRGTEEIDPGRTAADARARQVVRVRDRHRRCALLETAAAVPWPRCRKYADRLGRATPRRADRVCTPAALARRASSRPHDL